MTTEIIHGPPGSYKTSSLVSLYLYDALKSNRTIVTNIRGFVDIDQLNEIYNLDSYSEIIIVPHDKDGFEKMARFYQWVPKNAFILMDEGQRVYPSRLTKLNEFDLANHNDPEWPLSVEEAFDKHRHFGWDIYISTTNISKINREIRQVAEFAYRHKNMSGIIPGMKGRFKRVQHDPENNGKSLSHVLSSSIKKIDKRAFNVYKSTATDKAKPTKTTNAFTSSFKILFYGAVALCSIFYFVFFFNAPKASVTTDQQISQVTAHPVDNQNTVVPLDDIPSSHVEHRLDNQVYIVELLHSIQYISTHIQVYSSPKTHYYLYHSSRYGAINSNDLLSLGVYIDPKPNIHILSFQNHFNLVTYYDPNPDYYHPDNNEQPVESDSEALAAGVRF